MIVSRRHVGLVRAVGCIVIHSTCYTKGRMSVRQRQSQQPTATKSHKWLIALCRKCGKVTRRAPFDQFCRARRGERQKAPPLFSPSPWSYLSANHCRLPPPRTEIPEFSLSAKQKTPDGPLSQQAAHPPLFLLPLQSFGLFE